MSEEKRFSYEEGIETLDKASHLIAKQKHQEAEKLLSMALFTELPASFLPSKRVMVRSNNDESHQPTSLLLKATMLSQLAYCQRTLSLEYQLVRTLSGLIKLVNNKEFPVKDRIKLALLYSNLAQAESLVTKSDRAINLLGSALKLLRSMQQSPKQQLALQIIFGNISAIHKKLGDTSDAEYWREQVRDLAIPPLVNSPWKIIQQDFKVDKIAYKLKYAHIEFDNEEDISQTVDLSSLVDGFSMEDVDMPSKRRMPKIRINHLKPNTGTIPDDKKSDRKSSREKEPRRRSKNTNKASNLSSSRDPSPIYTQGTRNLLKHNQQYSPASKNLLPVYLADDQKVSAVNNKSPLNSKFYARYGELSIDSRNRAKETIGTAVGLTKRNKEVTRSVDVSRVLDFSGLRLTPINKIINT
jgi:tetratricopeptide (TPR) repeat protein